MGQFVGPRFARLFQISSWALGRASFEICEEVRSLFARNGVSSYNERVGQGDGEKLNMKLMIATLTLGTLISVGNGHLMMHDMIIADSLVNIFALIGAFVAWCQWRKSRMVSRTIFLNDLIKGFKEENLQKAFYEYIGSPDKKRQFYRGKLTFEPGSERDVDRLLTYYNKICYMRKCGAISNQDYRLFAYQIHKVLRCQQVKEYLSDMAFKSKTVNGDNYPFLQLVEEGNKLERNSCYGLILEHLNRLTNGCVGK